MRLYKTTITPISSFATPLKGDTLFGQICWAIRYIYKEDRLNSLLQNYDTEPFLIVSDGFASGYLPKPTLPSALLNESLKDKKINRKKIWLNPSDLQAGNFQNAQKSSDIEYNFTKSISVKNSINYLKFCTDDSGAFSPYSLIEMSFSKQDIYFLLSDDFTLDELKTALKFVANGYGKKASIGKGNFDFGDFEAVNFNENSKAFMTLSPAVLSDGDFIQSYYEPFTRFGKHGGNLTQNPFKAPLLLADTAAVVVYSSPCNKQFIGKGIKGHSTHAKSVHQGYAIVVATELHNES